MHDSGFVRLRRLTLISLVAASPILLGGCDRLLAKDTNSDQSPAATVVKEGVPAPAATGETPGGSDTSGAPSDPAEPSKTAAAAPSPAPKSAGVAPPKGPTGTITNGEKTVKSGSDGLKLENESGKGSVKTSGGTTTVTGKSGRSINLPSYR